MPPKKSKTPSVKQQKSASPTSKSTVKTSPSKESKPTDKPKALNNAEIRVKKIKDKSGENRLQAAYRYLENESWKHQGYESLDEAIQKEDLGITSKSLKRLAKSYQLNEDIHGAYVEGCSESALRPISSLTTSELKKIKKYLSNKGTTLKNKTTNEANKMFMEALAPSVIDDDDYIEVRESLTQITLDLLADAEVTSITAQNLVAEMIAMDFKASLRKALKKSNRQRRRSQNPRNSHYFGRDHSSVGKWSNSTSMEMFPNGMALNHSSHKDESVDFTGKFGKGARASSDVTSAPPYPDQRGDRQTFSTTRPNRPRSIFALISLLEPKTV